MSFSRAFASFIALFLVLFLASPAPAIARDITAGVAITDSDTMQELEASGLALSALFDQGWRKGLRSEVKTNAAFAESGPVAALRQVVRDEFKGYNEGFLARFPDAAKAGKFGTGTDPDYRKFERNFLDSAAARFHLAGVVNRMDRSYRSPETCGEVRLIYRLAYSTIAAGVRVTRDAGRVTVQRQGQVTTASRLPMTVNIVLKARPAQAAGAQAAVACKELARRWIATGNSGLSGKALARSLIASGGALEFVEPRLIDRMETNIQVIRVPSTELPDMGGFAEYLLHVFKWDPETRKLTRARLENQVDRLALLGDPGKLARLKAWLFTPERLLELDQGTVTIPDEYLAERAITSAPGGTGRATNRPFLGLVSDDEADQAVRDLKAAAGRLDPSGRLRNIESGFGLQQRLTDITCTGCHQSRAIGGFHFLGADWASTIREIPQNAIFVAGSPHFYGDQPRRRGIVEAIAAGREADFMRGFSMRPRLTTGRSVKTTFPAEQGRLRDGWSSNCYIRQASGTAPDPSFKDWGCASGLECRPVHESDLEPHIGVCLTPAGRPMAIGDPFLIGELKYQKVVVAEQPAGVFRFRDDYCMKRDLLNRTAAPGEQCLKPAPGTRTRSSNPPGTDLDGVSYQRGGFFGGMHRVLGCASNFGGDGVCATEAGTGFNKCIGLLGDNKTSFYACLRDVSEKSTLRACSVNRPCRDDYVCLATKDTPRTKLGACLPPYFLFQFRIDGHPTPPEGPADRS